MTFCILLFTIKQKSKNNQQKRMLKQKWTAASSQSQPFSVLCLRNLQPPWSLLVQKPKSGQRMNATGLEISDGQKSSELTVEGVQRVQAQDRKLGGFLELIALHVAGVKHVRGLRWLQNRAVGYCVTLLSSDQDRIFPGCDPQKKKKV